jgi:HEAT repeat protein
LHIAQAPKNKLELRKAAAGSLQRVRAPLEPTVAGLVALLDDAPLRTTATYVLGAMSRYLRSSGETERASRITVRLLQQLEQAKDDKERVATLHGLANTGDNQALAAIRPFVAHEDSSLRMAAAQTLAAMTSTEAESLLAERLEKEAATSVRTAVLNACAARAPTTRLIAAVEKISSAAPDPHGRIEAVRVLGRWMSSHPELRTSLEQIAKNDKEVKVREAAERLLQPIAAQPG